MNFTVKVDAAQLARQVLSPDVRRRLLQVMGREFWLITRANFGIAGIDRPKLWPALSKPYARKVARKWAGPPVPTLFRTGTLRNSIQLQPATSESVTIVAESELASVHHEGEGKMPARPFFPVINHETLTPYAERRLIAAANREIGFIFGS